MLSFHFPGMKSAAVAQTCTASKKQIKIDDNTKEITFHEIINQLNLLDKIGFFITHSDRNNALKSIPKFLSKNDFSYNFI